MIEERRRPAVPDVGVLVLAPDSWTDRRMARHQLHARMGRWFHVLWVDPAPSVRQALSRARPGGSRHESMQAVDVWRPGLVHGRVGRPAFLSRIQKRRLIEAAVSHLRRRGASTIVLYLWRPDVESIRAFPEAALTCYHMSDEYSFAEVETPISKRERLVIETVDQVFVHSHALMEKKGAINPNTELVPNGVDFGAFSRPADEPSDLRAVPRPRIGYAGKLKRQLDWELVLELARKRPDWSFVFVGLVKHQERLASVLSRLERLPNAWLLGGKSSDELATYPQHFDVCLMPYRVDAYTKYIYPLKLHEYLAAGRPAVSAPIPALEPFRGLIHVAESVDDWVDAIARSLRPEASSAESVEARRRVAREHDWDGLAERIARRLLSRLGRDGTPPP